MAFKIKAENIIKWPVKVSVPQDGGGFKTQPFTAHIKIINSDEYDEVMAQGEEAGDQDAAILKAVLVGWDGILADDGTEAPFTDETLEALSKIAYFRRAVIFAYRDAISGGATKN